MTDMKKVGIVKDFNNPFLLFIYFKGIFLENKK